MAIDLRTFTRGQLITAGVAGALCILFLGIEYTPLYFVYALLGTPLVTPGVIMVEIATTIAFGEDDTRCQRPWLSFVRTAFIVSLIVSFGVCVAQRNAADAGR